MEEISIYNYFQMLNLEEKIIQLAYSQQNIYCLLFYSISEHVFIQNISMNV